MSELFSDPKLDISEDGALRFFTFQRWISMIFASSPFLNADHVLQTYNRNPDKANLSDFHLDNTRSSLIKFCILYFVIGEKFCILYILYFVNCSRFIDKNTV